MVLLGAAALVQQDRRPALSHPPGISASGARNQGSPSRPVRRLAYEASGCGLLTTRYEYELPLSTDIRRALELDAKFEGLGLGLVDGMVAAVAERRRVYRVLTSGRRDYGAIRVGPRLTRALELLP